MIPLMTQMRTKDEWLAYRNWEEDTHRYQQEWEEEQRQLAEEAEDGRDIVE